MIMRPHLEKSAEHILHSQSDSYIGSQFIGKIGLGKKSDTTGVDFSCFTEYLTVIS